MTSADLPAPAAQRPPGRWNLLTARSSALAGAARPVVRSGLAVGVRPASDVLAILAIGLAHADRRPALVLAIVSLLVVLALPPVPRRLLRRGLGPTGRGTLARTALVLVVAVRSPVSVQWLAAAVVVVAVQLEPVTARLLAAAVPTASGLPGLRRRNRGLLPVGRVFAVNLVATLAVTLIAADRGPGAIGVLVAAVALGVTLVCCVDAAVRVVVRRTGDLAVAAALEAHAPRFALHWDSTPGTEYQLTMWLPHLERLGLPFVVVVRNPATFVPVTALTDAPVLLRRDPRDIDVVAVPSLTTVFYVNNAARNTHFVRFTGLEHVQLGHGDSDKAPSFSPVHRLYDHTFVSGPAAVERFARNGVDMAPELFTIVGRPQAGDLLVGASTSEQPTALYAPTWAGANLDSAHSSLPIGTAIVEALLQHGYRVLFRPHPYTRRSAALAEQADRIDALLRRDAARTGRGHEDAAATSALTLHECLDAADLLVADVSSVVSDFLQTEKPYLLTAMTPLDVEQQGSTLAAGGYVVYRDRDGLARCLQLASDGDPLLQARRALKAHVLGDAVGQDARALFERSALAVVLRADRGLLVGTA